MSEDRPVRCGESEVPASGRRAWIYAVVMLVVPGAPYAVVPAVPFLPLTTAQKIGLSSGLVVLAEAIFWGAALFVGGEAITRYGCYLDRRGWVRIK